MEYPIENFQWGKNVSQMFGVNSVLYRENFNIPGHNGIDIVIRNKTQGYGEPILATHDGIINRIFKDDIRHTKGNGIYLNSSDNSFTTIYWHLSKIFCFEGQNIKTGDKIGEMGNTGFVRPKPSEMYPYAGTHLHFGIFRFFCDNEYKGCVDPTPYIYKNEKLPIILNNDLFYQSEGDEVSYLQTLLKLEGYGEDYEPIGYFGKKTARDVGKFQIKNEIEPTFGYCGRKTRHNLNNKYALNYGIFNRIFN